MECATNQFSFCRRFFLFRVKFNVAGVCPLLEKNPSNFTSSSSRILTNQLQSNQTNKKKTLKKIIKAKNES